MCMQQRPTTPQRVAYGLFVIKSKSLLCASSVAVRKYVWLQSYNTSIEQYVREQLIPFSLSFVTFFIAQCSMSHSPFVIKCVCVSKCVNTLCCFIHPPACCRVECGWHGLWHTQKAPPFCVVGKHKQRAEAVFMTSDTCEHSDMPPNPNKNTPTAAGEVEGAGLESDMFLHKH